MVLASKYEIMDHEEATAAGAPAAMVVDMEPSDWDVGRSGVFRLENGAPVELLGTDGGEPEDQTLGRDWGWVPEALQAAYDRGRADGIRSAHASEGRM